MKIRPIGSRVLLRSLKENENEKMVGGIIIPASSVDQGEDDARNTGVVVAIGKKVDMDEYDIKVGDQVIYANYGVAELVEDGVTYYLTGADNLRAVLEDE